MKTSQTELKRILKEQGVSQIKDIKSLFYRELAYQYASKLHVVNI